MTDVPVPLRRSTDPPCYRCGVRADVGCAHQPASGAEPYVVERDRARATKRLPATGLFPTDVRKGGLR